MRECSGSPGRTVAARRAPESSYTSLISGSNVWTWRGIVRSDGEEEEEEEEGERRDLQDFVRTSSASR